MQLRHIANVVISLVWTLYTAVVFVKKAPGDPCQVLHAYIVYMGMVVLWLPAMAYMLDAVLMPPAAWNKVHASGTVLCVLGAVTGGGVAWPADASGCDSMLVASARSYVVFAFLLSLASVIVSVMRWARLQQDIAAATTTATATPNYIPMNL